MPTIRTIDRESSRTVPAVFHRCVICRTGHELRDDAAACYSECLTALRTSRRETALERRRNVERDAWRITVRSFDDIFSNLIAHFDRMGLDLQFTETMNEFDELHSIHAKHERPGPEIPGFGVTFGDEGWEGRLVGVCRPKNAEEQNHSFLAYGYPGFAGHDRCIVNGLYCAGGSGNSRTGGFAVNTYMFRSDFPLMAMKAELQDGPSYDASARERLAFEDSVRLKYTEIIRNLGYDPSYAMADAPRAIPIVRTTA